MAKTTVQQLIDQIQNNRHHLVVFRAVSESSTSSLGAKDAITSALALVDFLKKQGKQVDVVSNNFKTPNQLKFLQNLNKIKSQLPASQKCVITADIKSSGINSLSYDIQDGQLKIFLTPKNSAIDPSSVTAKKSDYLYDCIWILDTQDFASLGDVYLKNADMFHNTPTIVIDHHPANENFGKINHIDITSASTAEILFKIFREINSKDIDAQLATTLLTGIIAKTKSFKTTALNPQALTIASELMELGAERDKIIDSLFGQRQISTLKLWGAALSHIKYDSANKFVTSSITKDEFIKAQAHEHELPEIIEELITTSPEAEIIVLIYEPPTSDELKGLLYTARPFDAKELVSGYNPVGGKDFVEFKINAGDIITAQREISEYIKKRL